MGVRAQAGELITAHRAERAGLRPVLCRDAAFYLGALVLLLGAATLGVLVGPADLSPAIVFHVLEGKLLFGVHTHVSALDSAIVWQLRAPRVVLAAIVGATLATAGASYQGVFQNPLADPYLLGVAAGAGLGATLAVVVVHDPAAWAVNPIPLAAFAGALVSVALTYVLGRSGQRMRSTTSLILAGVAVASFLTAIQTYAQQRNTKTLLEVYSWILGGLSGADWQEVLLVLPYVAVCGVVLLASRRLLDVMAVGDEEADSLGVRATRVRLLIVVAATLATAAVVAVSGLVGFVGIIVPHAIRLVVGPSYRRILPLSILVGAAFLILADLVARTALSPAEVPLGVVTAFFGAPFFLVVLRQSRRAS
ncbi:MAG: iron ABC transporter permease [Acidimicrobiales bacterium]